MSPEEIDRQKQMLRRCVVTLNEYNITSNKLYCSLLTAIEEQIF